MAGTRSQLRESNKLESSRRSSRRVRNVQEDAEIPEIFQELLIVEHASNLNDHEHDGRPSKKRKVTTNEAPQVSAKLERTAISSSEVIPATARAQIFARMSGSSGLLELPNSPDEPKRSNDTSGGCKRQSIVDSDQSDRSDTEWEDALGDGNNTDDQEEVKIEPEIGDISITIGDGREREDGSKRQARRRAITSAERKYRLHIHKMHILCLLYHVHRRNTWCNDQSVQRSLRSTASPKALSHLVPNSGDSQYQASKSFMAGMNELKLIWSKSFSVIAQGMRRPQWMDIDAEVRPFSDFDNSDGPVDLEDFQIAARKLEGSQDIGAQLFCALLRAIGVEARLVCSLQCLPFASTSYSTTSPKSKADIDSVVLDPYNTQKESPIKSKSKSSAASRIKRPSRLERAIGERHTLLHTGVAPPKPTKKYHTAYPVYWVEAFNNAYQKWVAVDPLSTFTVNAPEKIEPPLSFLQNSMIYAIAYEEDTTVKDVTRRYAKAYNAKTRKMRVEYSPGGSAWWRRALKFFQHPFTSDRDQIEDAELARKESSEGLPRNVQDFKGHPFYVLERHLRHNEVLHPLKSVGKINVGSSLKPKMEPVYRRKDVHVVRGADKWYRLGRDVLDGEQPLKHGKPKKAQRIITDDDTPIEDQQEQVGVGLYADFQTQLYVPPPVVRGRVPRNAYGNLDVYVPSMCPPGGVHVRHKLASKAARIVGVDYAEAVTGFSFKGRHGTAVIQGIVVAQEYADAVQSVIEGMLYAAEEVEEKQRSAEALRLWRRLYLGLRIAQRVNAIEIDGETGAVLNITEEVNKKDRELAERECAGGFIQDEGEIAEPITTHPHSFSARDEGGSESYAAWEDTDVHLDSTLETERKDQKSLDFGSAVLSQQPLDPHRILGEMSGSLLAEDNDEGGGFVPEKKEKSLTPIKTNNPTGDLGVGSIANMDNVFSTHDSLAEHVCQAMVGNNKFQTDTKEQSSISHIDVGASKGLETMLQAEECDGYIQGNRDVKGTISSPSDQGSLLLEDPEDEDADPDWLIEAT